MVMHTGFGNQWRGSIPTSSTIISRRGAEVARQPHKLEVVGSIPTVRTQVATKYATPKNNKSFLGEETGTR